MWSNWRQVSARSGGQSLKKYNRLDITDHHPDPTWGLLSRGSQVRILPRHFPKEFADCAHCLGTRGEGTGEKSDRSPSKIG